MDFITSLLTEWGYLALFIIMALENMNIPIPSEIVLGFAGFLVFKGVFAFWPTILVGTAAGLTGSLLSYWMGYKGGRKILLKFSTKGGLTTKKLITGRLLPGIRTFISLPAGIAQYNLKKFIVFSIAGTIPWTMLLVYIGSILGENWETLLLYKVEIAAGAFLLVGMFIIIYLFFRKQK